MEQALCQRRGTQHTHGNSTCRLAKDSDTILITSKGCDIVLHPLQSHNLIHQTVVTRDASLRLGRKLGQSQEAQRTRTVGNTHEDNSSLGEVCAHRRRVITRDETTAVDPHHNGQLLLLRLCGRHHIDVEAVLAPARSIRLTTLLLRGHLGVLIRFIYALPLLQLHGRTPAQLPHGRLGIGDSLEHAEAILLHSLQRTLLDSGTRNNRLRRSTYEGAKSN